MSRFANSHMSDNMLNLFNKSYRVAMFQKFNKFHAIPLHNIENTNIISIIEIVRTNVILMHSCLTPTMQWTTLTVYIMITISIIFQYDLETLAVIEYRLNQTQIRTYGKQVNIYIYS